ncbi:hypothetical protein [Maridesulfovibrio frigidus]|uniref:hypothetical protein n=1 Tax=Maridesulfovibrio frigidus TaxID=340956 RepID=UPI0004E1A97F|nr:hypothetical protein [Maridesulfovibrio frigidus]
MSDLSLKQVKYGEFVIRYFVQGNIAYLCPADIFAVMGKSADEASACENEASACENEASACENEAWDKVETGRRIFTDEDFFEWFSVQFDGYDYSDDMNFPLPLPWSN